MVKSWLITNTVIDLHMFAVFDMKCTQLVFYGYGLLVTWTFNWKLSENAPLNFQLKSVSTIGLFCHFWSRDAEHWDRVQRREAERYCVLVFLCKFFLNWLKWNVQSFEPLIFINIGSSSYLFYDNCFQRFSVCINRPVAISLAVIICKLLVLVILTIVVRSIIIIN